MSEVSVQFDQKSLDRAKKTLAKYQGKPLADRLRRGATQAARLLVNPIRAASPRKTGKLAGSVKAYSARVGIGATVGPKAPHRHLVIQGHRIVTPGGRDTGRRTRANPFVDSVAASHGDAAVREIKRVLFEE